MSGTRNIAREVEFCVNRTIDACAAAGIIVAEGAFTALGLIGGVLLFLRRGDDVRFDKARTWGYAAYALGLVIWFIGFIVIGSEWFAMWQSDSWNGKDTAMPLAILFSVLAVLLAQNEPVRERVIPEPQPDRKRTGRGRRK